MLHNIGTLWAAQLAQYLLPLMLVPYLARVLGPASWGLVVFAQAFGGFVILVVEYGFELSGTREVARWRDEPKRLSALLSGVQGARTLLLLVTAVPVIGAFLIVPAFAQHPAIFWASMLWASAQSYSMLWFFRGLERIKLVAALDFASRLAAAGAIILVVRSPADAWRVPALQAFAALFSMTVAIYLASRRIRIRLPAWTDIWSALRLGRSMFFFRAAVGFYTTANPLVLGFFAQPQAVGYFTGAERISRAVLSSLTSPVSSALYPRICYLSEHDRPRAAQFAWLALIIGVAAALLVSAALFLAAPLIVRLLLGPDFAPAVPVMRILSLMIVPIAINVVLGSLWMLPLGMDRTFNIMTVTGGCLNIALAVLLAPRFAEIGTAWAVVLTEVAISCALIALLIRTRCGPWSFRLADQPLTTPSRP